LGEIVQFWRNIGSYWLILGDIGQYWDDIVMILSDIEQYWVILGNIG
jgi:hypothetical protein